MNATVANQARKLAIGCLYLLVRKAIPDFPTTTRSHPSEFVVVGLAYGKPLREVDRLVFPMKVPWYIWNNVVIPILTVTDPGTDPKMIGSGAVFNVVTGKCYDLGVEIKTTLRDSLHMEGNVRLMNLKEYDVLLEKLVIVIGMMMEDQGYVAKGMITG